MQLATLGLRENFFSYLRLRNMLRVVADSEDVGKAGVAVLQWFVVVRCSVVRGCEAFLRRWGAPRSLVYVENYNVTALS